MDGFRIRRAGKELAVPDVESLIRLARAGELGRGDGVHNGQGWVRAEEVAELRAHLRGDPWSAWQDVDNVDAAKIYKRMVEQEDEPEELPVDALTPMTEAPARGPKMAIVRPDPKNVPPRTGGSAPTVIHSRADGPPSRGSSSDTSPLPTHTITLPTAAHPTAANPTAAHPSTDSRRPSEPSGHGAEVIDFPRSPPPIPMLEPRQASRRPATQPLVRTTRVATLVMIGMFLLLIGYAWIQFAGSTRLGVKTVPPKAPVAAHQETPAAAFLALESEIRTLLPPTPREIHQAGDFADALVVEFAQMGVKVLSVDAPITKWVGRRLDEPKVAEVRVKFASSGDLTRDIGAIALVVGRYKRFYRLDIAEFVLTEASTGGATVLDPESAEQFYLGRIPLAKFLQGIKKPTK